MQCRNNCGACCIAISISSQLPNHPNGKPASVRCKNLDLNNSCSLYGTDQFPAICKSFDADAEFCGSDFGEAYSNFVMLEKITRPKGE
jgi:Fe-S-cluster containining protein